MIDIGILLHYRLHSIELNHWLIQLSKGKPMLVKSDHLTDWACYPRATLIVSPTTI